MTSPTAPNLPPAESTCCGKGGAWAPKAAEPFAAGCVLCPRSARYWQRPENRADGQPYAPVTPLGEREDSATP